MEINQILFYAKDIIESENMQRNKEFIQHGDVSIYHHCVNVAILSLKISNKLHLKVNKKSLIRGALLHDYFLYDWHKSGKTHKMHGFTHAKTALKNASYEYELNKVEKDIIKKHMFPLNIRPPRYKESIIVSISDKICAIKEIFD